jgi:hypothetical protein
VSLPVVWSDEAKAEFYDAEQWYADISPELAERFAHAKEYVRGEVHTQGLDNYWSLLKITLRGTYVAVEPFHLDRYLSEQAFGYNNRATKGQSAE